MARKINNGLFYTLLLSVYAIFFSVQFYNHDGQSDVRREISIAKNAPSHASSVHNSSTHTPSTHTIRLNKRFHQENIQPCSIFCVEAPKQYATPAILGHYRNVFLSSCFPAHTPLRGPPVVA